MGVRVRTEFASLESKSAVEANSLLNTGFESEGAMVLMPIKVAEQLGFWPQLPKSATIKPYETPGGVARLYTISDAVEIRVLTEDRISEPVKCALLISEVEREVLLSDIAIGELRIVIEDAGRGLWRFRGEEKARESMEAQYW